MATEMTPGEKAALFLTLGEQLVELVKESGLLKPKRRKAPTKRRKRKATADAAPKVAKKAPKKAQKPAPEPDELDDNDDDE